MLSPPPLVFWLDVDNTLLDNDRFGADVSAWIDQSFGVAERERYWAIYAALRDQLGYADYLGAVQQFRAGATAPAELQRMGEFLLEYPFAERLYPQALEAIAHLATLGPVVIVSDGDMVFQPRKIRHSGLAAAVSERVLIYVHKQESLADLKQRFPAAHYVMVDDKPLLLAEMKRTMGAELTSIFVRQGHYAADSASATIDPAPDRSIACIGDLRAMRAADFHASAALAPTVAAPELR